MEIKIYNNKGKLEAEKEIKKNLKEGHYELVVKDESIEIIIKPEEPE